MAVEGVFSNLLALAVAVPIGSGWLPSLFNNDLQGSRSYDEGIGRGEAIQMASQLVINLVISLETRGSSLFMQPRVILSAHRPRCQIIIASECSVDKQPLNYILPHLFLQRGQILPLLSDASKHATVFEDGARLKDNLLATQAIAILNASKAVSVTFHLESHNSVLAK